MIFRHFLLAVNESNAFVVGCSATGEALLVDAGDFPAIIDEFLEEHGLTLGKVFITHDHFDHTGGLSAITQRHNVEVLAGGNSAGGCRATRVRQGTTIQVGELSGTVLETPGHTSDSVSLAFPGMVFTGDALFAGSVGGTGSNRLAQMQIGHIRDRIFTLAPDTAIHTGHGPSSTVGIESGHNPFFV